MSTIGENIKQARKKAKLTQLELSKLCGYSRPYIAELERDSQNPSLNALTAIANALNTSIQDLVRESDVPYVSDINYAENMNKAIKIPVLGEIIAGVPIEAIENIIDYEEISVALASTGDFFALKVKGRSMEPILCEGDVVIVRKQSYIESDQIAVIMINGDLATVKKVQRTPEGITLIGYNVAEYMPQTYTNDEIISLPVTILGRVIEARRKF